MKTCVDVERARAMREQGMTLREIGDEFGVTRERIRQLVGSPPRAQTCLVCGRSFETTRANKQCCSRSCANAHWLETNRRRCVDCGKPVSPRAARCVDCELTRHERNRAERWTLITKFWNEGVSVKAMALQLGTTPGALSVQMAIMKHAGWELAPRRAGWNGHESRTGPAPSENPPKTRAEARARFAHAVRSGRLARADVCERCGREGHVDGHHHDYSKPLDVEWLCRSCHIAHHVTERRAA